MDNTLISTIKDLIDKSEAEKTKTTQMLIQLKINIHQANVQINEIEEKSRLTDRDLDHIEHLSQKLIFYISTWCIYLHRGIINKRDVKNYLGGFLMHNART